MAKREVETKYYEFDQNNSGGSFDIDDARGIGPRVWIEALSTSDAEDRAERLGIYFDGCSDGRDCPCCGDRWHRLWRDDGKSKVELNAEYDFNWHETVYVHHIDGAIDRLKSTEAA